MSLSSLICYSAASQSSDVTGTPAAGDQELKFRVITDVAAMVETMPLERALSLRKDDGGQSAIRMVLTMRS